MQDMNAAALLAGILVSNIAVMVGAYVSLRVSIAEFKVALDNVKDNHDKLSSDVDKLANKMRDLERALILGQKKHD